MRLPLLVFVALGLVIATASPARAQRVTAGASVGPSLPASEFNVSHKPGLNAAAHVGIGLASVVSLRLEGSYNLFDNTAYSCAGPCILPGYFGGGPMRITGAAVNVLVNFGEERRAAYLIFGGGPYAVKPGADESRTYAGLNAGAGGRFPVGRMRAFVEARFHTIRYDKFRFPEPKLEYIPLTFGLQF
jgi:hypothetical protein